MVGDIEVSRAVHRHAEGVVQLRTGGLGAVAAEAWGAIARHGGDGAAGGDLADALVAVVGDIEVARAVHGSSGGLVDVHRCRRHPLWAQHARARYGGDGLRLHAPGQQQHAEQRNPHQPAPPAPQRQRPWCVVL